MNRIAERMKKQASEEKDLTVKLLNAIHDLANVIEDIESNQAATAYYKANVNRKGLTLDELNNLSYEAYVTINNLNALK